MTRPVPEPGDGTGDSPRGPWELLTSIPVLALAAFVMTLASAGPLQPLDTFLNTPFALRQDPELRNLLIDTLDNVAARAVCLPLLGLVAVVLARRLASWRPVVVAGAAVFSMIAVVASMKLTLSRAHPRDYDPSFFAGGVAFPSGHTANAVLIYGVLVHLLVRYGGIGPALAARLRWVVVGITVVQSAVSVFLHFHWFTDLVTGAIVGGMVLRATVELDRRWSGGPPATTGGGHTVPAARSGPPRSLSGSERRYR